MIPVLLRLFANPTLNTRKKETDGEYTGKIQWEHVQNSPLPSYTATWRPDTCTLFVRAETASTMRRVRVALPRLSGGARPDIILERAQFEFERQWSKK